MTGRDRIAALLVVSIWGINFVFIKIAVGELPPMLVGALRFILLAFPAVLLVKRPNVALGPLVAYAMTISFGQFAFLFSAMAAGMPAGLVSLLVQTQAFIAPLIAMVVLGERMKRQTVIGLGIAGVGLVALVLASRGESTVTAAGLVLTIAAAMSWAVGNILSKRIGGADPIGLVVWSALVPIVPFLATSAVVDGLPRMAEALAGLTLPTLAAVGYLSYGASLVGYGLWSSLIARHPVQVIAPLTLAIPVVGILAAWALLGETLSAAQIGGSAIILAGLVVNLWDGGRRGRAR